MSGHFRYWPKGRAEYRFTQGGGIGLGAMLFDGIAADLNNIADGWNGLMTFLSKERHVHFVEDMYMRKWIVGRGYWDGDQKEGRQVLIWSETEHDSLGAAVHYALKRLEDEARDPHSRKEG